MGLEQPIDAGFRDEVAFLVGEAGGQLSQTELDRCMSAAQEIWPSTGLLPWESASRSVAYAWKSNDGRHIEKDRHCFTMYLIKFVTRLRTALQLIEKCFKRGKHSGPSICDFLLRCPRMESESAEALITFVPTGYM